jgi:hypothetical protein
MKACGAVNEADYLRRLLRGKTSCSVSTTPDGVPRPVLPRRRAVCLSGRVGRRATPSRVLSAPLRLREEAWSSA